MPDLINFSTMQANESAANCLICGDKATGKHYGVTSCDGCKGFFRRTIRKRTHYVCRFDKTCVVDKAQRNTCRRCRFDECIRRGMRKEAVQQERDRIAARSSSSRASAESSTETSPPATNALLDVLLAAEAATRQLRSSVITRTADAAKRMATTGDVTDSMHQQLILMVEWAKQLPEFQRLPMDAQVALLRHFSAQHLVMCAAFRSTHVKDAVWLTNETCLHKDSPKVPDVNRVAARIVDHLTNPMRLLQMNETEYVALKAVAFFDPRAEGSSGEIEDTRQKVLSAFEEHVTRLSPLREMPRRLCNLLLLLPPMLAISRDLVEDVQLAKLFGLANIDSLMQELMLPQDTEPHFPKLGDVKP